MTQATNTERDEDTRRAPEASFDNDAPLRALEALSRLLSDIGPAERISLPESDEGQAALRLLAQALDGAVAALEVSISETKQARERRDFYYRMFLFSVRGGSKSDKSDRIYFIKSEESGLIKIGFSTNVSARKKGLQTGSGGLLILLGDMPGDKRQERELHLRFSHLRRHGEWFRAGPELLQFIESLKVNPG